MDQKNICILYTVNPLCHTVHLMKSLDKWNTTSTTLKWPSLEARRKYQISLQVFKCLNGLAPVYLLNQFSFSWDYHSYKTRHRDLIRMPLAKTSKFQSSFKYNGAREWNSSPSYLRQESSLSLFKKNLKRHLCDRLFDLCMYLLFVTLDFLYM